MGVINLLLLVLNVGFSRRMEGIGVLDEVSAEDVAGRDCVAFGAGGGEVVRGALCVLDGRLALEFCIDAVCVLVLACCGATVFAGAVRSAYEGRYFLRLMRVLLLWFR